MNTRTALVAGAALGAFTMSGFAADAKPVHHRHLARGPSELSVLREEVSLLKAKVDSLEGRLEDATQPNAQTQAQIAQMQSQAQAAQAQAQNAEQIAQANQAKIETLPSEVTAEVKKATPKPGWAADTTVGVTIFADASNISNKNDGVKNAQSGTNYDIKRAYLSVDHKFNNVFSADLTSDVTYDSATKASQLFIKKAYLQAKLSDAFIIRAGAAEMPWIPFAEKIYGYRYVEQTLIDRTKYGTSTDWGLHAFGSLAGGVLGYQVSVVNGNGYKIPSIGTANRTSSLDVEGRINATLNGFTVAVGGYEGKLGKAITNTPTYNSAQRVNLLAAYVNDRFRVGGEYFWAKDWNDVTQSNPLKVNNSQGYSFFGSFNFNKQIAAFGRYDWVKPQESTAPTFVDHYFNLGVSYSPIKQVDLALVYKRDAVDNGLISTGNGTIGGVSRGTYDEIGVFTQVKF